MEHIINCHGEWNAIFQFVPVFSVTVWWLAAILWPWDKTFRS